MEIHFIVTQGCPELIDVLTKIKNSEEASNKILLHF